MNAIERFDRVAAAMGTAPAVVWSVHGEERTVSFAALADRSRRIGALFRDAGLVPGDAVLVMLPVTGVFFTVTAALLRAGLTGIFVDPIAWRSTLEAARRHARVRALVGTPLACALRPFVDGLRRLPLAFAAGHCPGARPLGDASRTRPLDAADCSGDATALVSFTSGTTGAPKGVLRTHGLLDATARALEAQLELAPGETHLAVLPFIALANLGAGVTSVIPSGDLRHPGLLDPAALASRLRERRVDAIVASPRVAQRLAEHVTATSPLAALARVYVGGAAVLPPLLDALARAAPSARIASLYGATEVEPIASVDASAWGPDERAATCRGAGVLAGMPCEGIDVRVVRESPGSTIGPCDPAAFDAMTMRDGDEGEIVVAGHRVSPGYLDGAADAAAKIVVGSIRWHRTGDTGYRDSAGRLWLTGRSAQRVPFGDSTIHPLRVEAALAGEPSIARAGFLDERGVRVLAIEPRNRLENLPLRALCARVAFAAPQEVALVRRIPLDPRHAAKIDYRTLAADLTAGRVLDRRPVPNP